MTIATLKLKWIYLPLAIGAAAVIGLTAAHRAVKHDVTVDSGQQVEVGQTTNTELPKVTINGQEVTGEGHFSSDGATVDVNGGSTNVTTGGGSTTVVNDKGGIDVHVESKSSNSNSSQTFVQLGGGTFTSTQSDNSISVQQSGEGNVSASN